MTTRSSFTSQVAAIIQRDDLTTRIQTALNTVLERIARKYDDFRILRDEDTSVTTVVGTYTYTLPTNTHRIYRIVYEDGNSSVDLVEITPGEFDRKYPYPSSLGNGPPAEYCRRNETTIDFDRPCDDTNTLRIYRTVWPTLLSGSSDEPQYLHIDDVILYGTVAEIQQQLGLIDDAAIWQRRFEQELERAHEKDIESPNKIQSGVGWGWTETVKGEYWSNPFFKG